MIYRVRYTSEGNTRYFDVEVGGGVAIKALDDSCDEIFAPYILTIGSRPSISLISNFGPNAGLLRAEGSGIAIDTRKKGKEYD